MKTKLITLLFAIVASIGTTYAYSYIIEINGIWYDCNLNTKTASVTNAGGEYYGIPVFEYSDQYDKIKYSDSIYVPSYVKYEGEMLQVSGIGDHAFYHCDELTYVHLPKTITYIDASAFEDCGVTSIIIPDSVTSIGEKAFSKAGLQSVVIGDGVTTISKEAFDNCQYLTSVVIGNNVTSIGDYAFYGCRRLTSVTIPTKVTSIGKNAFAFSGLTSVVWNPKRCSLTEDLSMSSYNPFDRVSGGVTSFTFGDEVEVIPGSLCYHLPITSLTLPNSVDSIGEFAFGSCEYISSLTIPNNVKSIESGAFSLCTGLTSVNIGNGLSNIGEYIFYGCTSLESVTFGDNIKSIDYQAFMECESLTSITIPNSVIWLGCSAFAECENLSSVTLGKSLKSLGCYAFSGCNNLKSIEIPESVTFIGEKAFYNMGLKNITIPINVDSVGERAFGECDSLISVTWNAKNVVAYDGNYNTRGKFFENSPVQKIIIGEQVDSLPDFGMGNIDTLVWNVINYSKNPIADNYGNLQSPLYRTAYNINHIRFGNKVESIPMKFSWNNSSLKSLTIPDNVKTIGDRAFHLCYGLQSVIIGNGVTTIEGSAFSSCDGLTTLIIGKGVTNIEQWAFSCLHLESATCYATTPPSYDNSFNTRDTKTIYVPAESVDAYKAANGWKDHNILPIGATSTTTTGIKINPSDYSANITWLSVSGATVYELIVRDKRGNVVCKVTFDADGLLTSIAFHAPSRNEAPHQTQDAGFSYTIIGLKSGTEYDLTITAKNASGSLIDEQTISFTTEGEYTGDEQGIEDTFVDTTRSNKLLRNGQLLILRGDKTYTVTGQEIK